MFELIATIVFLISAVIVFFILYRKVPVLASLPKNGSTGFKKHHVILDIENKIKDVCDSLEHQKLLHKILSQTKCLIMKIEVKIDHLLHSIRRKAQEKKK